GGALRQVPQDPVVGDPPPHAGRRPHRLRPLAQGGGHPHPGQLGNHQGQRLDTDRRSAIRQEIVDPYMASYGVENPIYAVIQLAQTTMRSELGKITLDKTFEERDTLNTNIVKSINEAAETWGLKCLRYEIRDITPPDGVKKAMEMQAAAERKKRAQILESEGAMMENANKAKGEAEAILARSQATAEGIRMVSESFKTEGSTEAASLRIAEQYIRAFSELARTTNTMLLPSDAGNPGTMIAQALQIYNHTYKQKLTLGSPSPSKRAEEADLSLGMPSVSDLGTFQHQK
uniref:Band 7 domain-containing protein n=1 Tax=Aegilops tauschii subsp. strangulata TaxID=200361 RepID=A0A453ML05_AEGTS